MTFPAVDTFASYGGALLDYVPVLDPTTDRPASGENQMLASAAALTHTATQVWWRSYLTGLQHDECWASSMGLSGQAIFAHPSTGILTLTWPTTITDALGVAHTVNFRWATVEIEGNSTAIGQASVTSPNVVTVWLFNTSFVLTDITNVVVVEAG